MHDDVFSMNMHHLVDTIDIIDSCASRDQYHMRFNFDNRNFNSTSELVTHGRLSFVRIFSNKRTSRFNLFYA